MLKLDGVSIDFTVQGWDALTTAVYCRRGPKTLQVLLEAGADPNTQVFGTRILEYLTLPEKCSASMHKEIEDMVRCILRAGYDIESLSSARFSKLKYLIDEQMRVEDAKLKLKMIDCHGKIN